MIITKEEFPNLHNALENCAYDNGMINALTTPERLRKLFSIHPVNKAFAIRVEAELRDAKLNEDEMLTFVAGEQEDMFALVNQKNLYFSHTFLALWFDGDLNDD